MQSFVVFMLLFLSGSVFADERANKYIENFLSTAFASEIHSLHLEPAALPEFEIEFEEHVKIFGKVKGKAEFQDGSMEGLAEARRQLECHGLSDSGSRRTVNCTIAFDKLKVRYEGKLKYGRIPKMGISGKAKITDTLFYLEVVQESPMQPILRNFTCTQMGSIKVKFTGLGPLNRFMNILQEAYARQVRSLISSDMSQKLQYAINRALSKDLLLF